MTYRVMGGLFGLEEIVALSNGSPPFLKDGSILLANARSGISLLLEILSPFRVWVPSYLCTSILEATTGHVTSVRFYEVNSHLALASPDWLDNVRRGDLVIFINYFGFPQDPVCATRAKEQGAWVLEDACQALLSVDVGRFSDFILFSPRKFLGVPDGGILVSNGKVNFTDIKLSPPPSEWWLKSFFAAILRRDFDLQGGCRRWFQLFQEVEASQPVGHYAMSELARLLLVFGFDYSSIAQRRRDNYRYLADVLSNLAIFPILLPGVVPLGFPIRVKNRDRIRQTLFDHDIYPPIHWPIQGIVPEDLTASHALASEIMTLPCDQRYDRIDMNRMTQIILEELKF